MNAVSPDGIGETAFFSCKSQEGELMADSILNRIATGARYIDLDGPNMREYFAKKNQAE